MLSMVCPARWSIPVPAKWGGGYPSPTSQGVPQFQLGLEYPLRLGLRYALRRDMIPDTGVHPSPPVDRQTLVKTLPSPILQMPSINDSRQASGKTFIPRTNVSICFVNTQQFLFFYNSALSY